MRRYCGGGDSSAAARRAAPASTIVQEAENLWSTTAVRRIAAAGRWVRAAGGAVLLVDRPVGERDPAAEPRGQAPGLQIVLGESNQLVGLRAAGCVAALRPSTPCSVT
jgi:hypothetical protein